MRKIKSSKGITLTSLIIYITIMFVLLATITRVIVYFRTNMVESADVTFETEFEKLNLRFLEETKRTGNEIKDENSTSTTVEFTSGNRYSYDEESKKIKLNDNIIICEKVESCIFSKEIADNTKQMLKVIIKIGETEKEVNYVVSNNINVATIDEGEYTNILIPKTESSTNGEISIENTTGKKSTNYKIYGNTVQNGTPTPLNPIEVQGVGDLVTDETDPNYGKYIIPITATSISNNTQTQTVNIYLNEPLMRLTYSTRVAEDYIDYESKSIVKNTGIYTVTGNENWHQNPDRADNNIITIRRCSISGFRYNTSFYSGWKSNKLSWLYALWNYNTSSQKWMVCTNGTNGLYISVDNQTAGITAEDDTATRIAKFKTYLQGQDIKIYYPLAETITESIDLPDLPTYAGGTTYRVETTAKPTNFEVTAMVKE